MAITLSGDGTITGLTSTGISAAQTVTSISSSALPAGTVLQVVSATSASVVSTTSSSFVDTGLSASITPTSASSKILVVVSQSLYINNNTGGRDEAEGRLNLTRASTNIYEFGIQIGTTSSGTQKRIDSSYPITILDSPATTSSVTYKTQMRGTGFEDVVAQRNSYKSAITLIEVKT